MLEYGKNLSIKVMDEIKYQIKDQYGSQEKFAIKYGLTRKQLSRILNHNRDFEYVYQICMILGIKEIQII